MEILVNMLGRSFPRVRILLADDHQPTLLAVKSFLEAEHNIVGAVSDGQSLIEAIEKFSPDAARRGCLYAANDCYVMNLEKKDLLRFALAVIVTTTLIVSCFPLFQITSNWAANVLMFVPGLVAALLLLRRREGFRSIGWGVGPWRYWLAAIILPTLVISVAIALSLRFGCIAPAPASTPAGNLIAHPAKLLKNMLIYVVISLPLAFGEEFGWRGYAQNRLIRQFGIIGGLLGLSGASGTRRSTT